MSLPFLASGGLLQPWLATLASCCSSLLLLLSHVLLCLIRLCFPLIKSLVLHLGPTWINQDSRSILRSITQPHAQGPFCVSQIPRSQG